MASNGCMVSEYFILYRRLPATNRVEKVSLMVGGIVVAMRRSKGFGFVDNLDP